MVDESNRQSSRDGDDSEVIIDSGVVNDNEVNDATNNTLVRHIKLIVRVIHQTAQEFFAVE